MSQRDSWQYCQIEVISNDQGVLRQFFADRAPVEMQLFQNWPSMIGKLGLQGWELISAVPGASGKSSIIYVFSRKDRPQSAVQQVTTSSVPAATSTQPPPPQTPPEDHDDGITFVPLSGL